MKRMDFQKNWDLFSFSFPFSEIPVSLRNLFSQTFRYQPLRHLGAGYYRASATRIAKVIQNTLPKTKVYLRGHDLEHLTPGVFDLDFLILKEKEIKEKEIWDLRTDYFDLKRKFPVIGNIALAQAQDFKALQLAGLADYLGFSDLKKMTSEGWKSKKTKETASLSYSSRLALSIYYFERAQKYLIKSHGGNSSFYRTKFSKEIGRALFVCSGEKLGPIQSQNPSVLMAHAYYQIQQLAKLAVEKTDKEKNDFRILFPEKKGARFSAEMINRSWIHKLKRGDQLLSSLRPSSAPLVLLPSENLNLVSSVNLLTSFINLWPAFLQESKEIPVLIPRGAFELMSLGWHWRKPYSHLGWSYPSQSESGKWHLQCAKGTHHRLKERVLFERCLILGKLVTGSPELAFKSLKTFCRNLLVLEAKENLSDALLVERCRESLPKTCEVFKLLLANRNVLNLQTLVKASLMVLNETTSTTDK